MTELERNLAGLQVGADIPFLLAGAVLVFAMHGGFAFLEAGTVRHKSQVNALCRILVSFAVSVIAYFFVGCTVAYGITFFLSADAISAGAQGYDAHALTLVRFFFLAALAAAVPAIVSGGIAERVKFLPQCVAAALIVGIFYPFLEGIVWNGNFGLQEGFFKARFGAEFHDFAGSVVVHATGGWMAFAAVRQLGPRLGRYEPGRVIGIPPSSILWLGLGSWLLCLGWFGFNVMNIHSLQAVSVLVTINALMAMCGGIIAALIAGDGDPGFVHSGALAGLVAVCAGSDVMHPIGALVVGGVAGVIFVYVFQLASNEWKIDDVLGVWALHGLCGLWGGIACGIFGLTALGGMGGVTFTSQLVGSLMGAAYGALAGFVIYGAVDTVMGLRLSAEEERRGADLTVHKIGANPEEDVRMGRI